ncbi:MAG TPA: MATE family efflux transporter, partial [Opitutaceae bacterium]
WPSRWFAPISLPRLRRMLGVGLPAAGCLLFEGGAFAAATVMMGWLGSAALAAHQIALSCAAMTFMAPLALSMAVGMRISSAVGSGEHTRLRPIWLGGAGAGFVVSLAMTVAFLAYGRQIAGFFVQDTGVISTAPRLLVVAAVFQIFDGGQVIHSAALRGLTDVRMPAAITFVAYWVVALPLAYLFGIRGTLGPQGIWIGLAVGLAVAAILLGHRFLRLSREGVAHTH